MIVVRILLRLRVVLLSACMSSALAAVVHAAPSEPQPANPWPAIVFYVAKGEPNTCGAGCSEWIAAEGTIDENAHRRLHGLLNRLDRRKLPIYFHAPGGSLDAAMAIGRMMRERGITAGVGRTIPRGCDPLQEHEAVCDSLKRAGRELLAELRTARTLCNSACVYALIGARVREVGAGARIGVHEIAISRYDERALPVPVDRKSLSQAQLKHLQAAEVQLARYIGDMGIDKALFDAAAQIAATRSCWLRPGTNPCSATTTCESRTGLRACPWLSSRTPRPVTPSRSRKRRISRCRTRHRGRCGSRSTAWRSRSALWRNGVAGELRAHGLRAGLRLGKRRARCRRRAAGDLVDARPADELRRGERRAERVRTELQRVDRSRGHY
jgi:hypothetical protein